MRRSLITGVALALALAACGSTGPEATKVSTVELVAGAADRASDAKTARISGREVITVDGATTTIPIEGAIDFTSGDAELRIDLGSLGLAGGGSIQALVVDQAMYMDFGALLRGNDVPASLRGKQWLKLDLRELGAAGSGSGSGAASYLDALRGAGDVRQLGTETIDGVRTDHYRVTIDTAAAIEKLEPGPLRDLAEEGLSSVGRSYPMDVWIDGDGFPRRVRFATSASGARIAFMVDYHDFGKPLDVAAPPPARTADFSELLGLVGTANAN